MKKIIFKSLVMGVIILSSCNPVYVATPPVQNVVVRPASPSVYHVWVEGNWVRHRRYNNYQWRGGYWAVPHRHRVYNQGYWRTNRRGHYWVKGRWH